MARRIRVGAATLALLAALAAGCGGDDDAPPPVPVDPAVEREVRAVFDDYTRAMAAGDHAAACGHLAPRSVEALRVEAREFGLSARECPALLDARRARAGEAGREVLEEIARTVRVDGVFEAPEADDAVSIAWVAEIEGTETPVQQFAERVDGEWKLVGGQ